MGAHQPAKNIGPLAKGTQPGSYYDLSEEGIAHYGMLPEFFKAVSIADQDGSSINKFYRSADAFVKT